MFEAMVILCAQTTDTDCHRLKISRTFNNPNVQERACDIMLFDIYEASKRWGVRIEKFDCSRQMKG